jgi:hypothetical protein
MSKDFIGYETLADNALRGVVREALRITQKRGLVASHHFFITFKTHDPGVDIPDFLKERYPDEMTIVLQNQYSGLHVEDDFFQVMLSFQKIPATLVIPFAAVTAFVDPGVQFGLQFRNSSALQQKPQTATDAAPKAAPPPKETAEENTEPPHSSGPQVVSLDKFRKK